MNLRGWMWLSDEDRPPEQEALVPVIEQLAERWSRLVAEREQEGWRRQMDREEGNEPEFETEEECRAWRVQERAGARTRELELHAIETQLSEYGARMMRPYEHWNEEETRVEWEERDRSEEF